MARRPQHRIGLGFDAHALRKGRRLVLGGVTLPGPYGLAGHSDADVLLHAIADALLGALAQPDIGMLFPNTDEALRGADSAGFVSHAMRRVRGAGYRVENVDCVVVADSPRLAPHWVEIRTRLASLLAVEPHRIGLKAKTTEGTRLACPKRSIAAQVVVLLRQA